MMKKNVVIKVLQLSENSDWKDGRMEGRGREPNLPILQKDNCIKGLGASCKSRMVIMFLAIYVLFMPKSALAHKMMMDSMVNDDGTVLLEAFFPDGSPARNTKVEVFSPDGSLFAEGTTNVDGQFTFTPAKKEGAWKAVATGKMGHKTSTEFEIVAGARNSELKQESKRIAHKEPIPWNQIISGFGFIFGMSAFIISLKLRADLKRLKNALTSTRN
ncbi:MAG: hypothetical protein ACE5PV_05530 [Candidatus Poribacteria bacterium]